MITAEKKYIKVTSIQEAIHATKENKTTSRYLAGGTDLMANKFQGNENGTCLIDITGIDSLKKITKEDAYYHLGPLVTLSEITKHPIIKKEIPALADAAHSVGTPLIRSTATIGGNLLCENRCLFYNQSAWWREAVGHCLKCNGDICIATGGANACFSEMVSDTAPVLISLETSLKILNTTGEEKTVLLKDIYTGDGVKPRTLSTTDLITDIMVPVKQNCRSVFRKLRLRESLEFTSLSSAVSIDINGKIRITLAGMDPKPVYIETDANESLDALHKRLLKASHPVNNDVFTRNYRRDMVRVFVEQSYKELGI
ncbi:MAG TPA: FAD binding domain-containing protein [Bacteroidia bacterium]|nr:FAD binding domain-containing protein [Bacteroidia bacterium]